MLHASSPVVGQQKAQTERRGGRRHGAIKREADAGGIATEAEMTGGPGDAIEVSIEQEEPMLGRPLERLEKLEIFGFARHVAQCSGSTS